MHIAIEGCSHGELDIIYRSIERLQQIHKFKIDLLLCCGDFQAVRNEQDLKCMAVPVKYMQMQDFHKYYSGEKKAPVLTIFIGGNHEASNYLQELPYGGWVAPNIYYLGYAGVVTVGGLRIGGLSGIYKGSDYLKGHYEKTPYTNSSIRSVYHVRNLEVFRLKQISNHIDIFLSHDWPRGIYRHGNMKQLLKVKPHFEADIKDNSLGSRPAEDLIAKLRPNYWFSGHLHVKFAAIMKHEEHEENKPNRTKFLALDKCLPRRQFLQVLEIETSEATDRPLEISHDAEWLTVLRLTNHLLSTSFKTVYMPGPGAKERYNFTPTPEEIEDTLQKVGGSWTIPANSFKQTAKCFSESLGTPNMNFVHLPEPFTNPQTVSLCSKLGIDDPVSLLLNTKSAQSSMNMSEIDISDVTDMSNISCNPEEIDITDSYDGDVSGISRDEATGDIIVDLPPTSIEDSFSKKTEANITPVRGMAFSTPKRSADSTRSEQRHRLNLSNPNHMNEITISPLTLSEKNRDNSSLQSISDEDPAGEESPNSSLSFIPLSVSKIWSVNNSTKEDIRGEVCQDEMAESLKDPTDKFQNPTEELFVSDTKERSPPMKREGSFASCEYGADVKDNLSQKSSTKKFKRRNASFYASAED